MSYQDQILIDIQKITGLYSLSKQALWAVIFKLIKNGDIFVPKPKGYISKSLYFELRKYLLNADMFSNGIVTFKEYYKDWKREQMKFNKDDYNNVSYEKENKEEDMSYVSDELLNKDEIYY